ncbi:Mannosyl-oligosaccharide 1,2-alpha-mannosidase IB [Fulvia fulva]|uniref:alpha-1,2-Mannosidase n=1 Tax=Passalora fulva TaxID=5499 RepID=A0A9Q8UV74_PASFU|nr:Mannosyl-oligosaccharide 1,2-alpha-mannosidase IB [Fulvia fulva]KAK4613195.1 Mannosyl-oligosaccharide 1,2-alpha-mannosidase IB [Fulvia fulva]UJO23678.1 Mannosyl-oligosaccharide 1,2-alpha-mannosidase IB [Fulvia fulva]
MPGRTRRVRLLAVVVCIVTVFFLYTRNEARVGEYADYVRGKTAIGGGAVLRGGEKQEPIQEPSLPDARPETKAAVAEAQETAAGWRDDVLDIAEPTTTPPPTTIAKARPTEESTTVPYVPSFDDPEELPIEVGNGRVEEDYDPYIHTSTYVPIHWSKLSEKFPVTSTIQLPTGKPSAIPRVQKQGQGTADAQRLAAVKEAARWAWKGFRENGWDYDEVKPISGVGSNTFNGWGATLVDSLDTLWIMGLRDEFEDAVNKTSQIDFTTSSRNDIPMFEVTIRYLGGLLGAYDVSGRKYKVLLDKAVELAEILYSAFDTPNRMPETYYYWKPTFATNAHRASTRVVMAELGTLSLEFTRLAQLTLEPKYYDAIARITDEFEKWQNNTRLPGMWPTIMDASGCEKPVYHPPAAHQVPIPGGNTYTTTTEPIQVNPKVQKAAEDALNDSKAGAKYTGQGGGDEVVNPQVYTGAAGAADGSRRPMQDEYIPNGFGSGAAGGKASNEHNAKEPLRHDTRPGSGVDAASDYGKGDREPLPPKGGAGDLNKRQLEDYGETVAPAETKPKNTTSITKPQHKQGLRQLEYDGTAEEPEEMCITQGFASSSKNAPETFSLGGQSDSTYEYLPKEFLLLGGLVPQYKSMYLDSMKPIVEKLIFRPMTPDNLDILISGEVRTSKNYTTDEWHETHVAKNEHLTCFVGGMIGMGGKIFEIPEHVEIGRKLTDGCIWSYNVTGSGIMPESYMLSACDSWTDCKWNQTKYEDDLDPYSEFRADQREDFKETYGIDDLDAYEEELAVASKSAAAGLAAATSEVKAPSPAELNAAEDAHTFGEFGGTGKLRKRQQVDDRVAMSGAPPLPQPKPKKAPTTTADSADFAAAADSDKIWTNDNTPYTSGTPTISDDEEPVPAAPVRPAYTPPPPMTHKQYVEHKIEMERLPKGFVRLDSKSYILRPEAIESVFYMYRITGEQYWRDRGWEMFMAIEKATHAPYGHSRIDDVTKEVPDQTDGMESFWIAETLKYFYLLFDEPDRWSLDDWVLNTEAHFFRRPDSGSA